MADARRVDTALIQDILRSGSRPERAAAALAVGQVHGTALAPTLRTLLADRRHRGRIERGVRARAARGHRRRRGTRARARRRRPRSRTTPRGRSARSASPRAPRSSRRSRRPLRRATRACAAISCSRRSGSNPFPSSAVRPWLADSSALVRWSAAYAIARPYAAAGVRDLIPLATDTSGEVRAQVARAFSHRAAGDSLAALVRAPLATLASDPNPHVRINALRSLATYGASSKRAVVAATRDPDANVRVAAAEELGSVLDNTRAAWMSAWKADTGFMYRRSVLVSAMSQDVVLPAAELDEPDSWAHQSDWRLRAAVADAGGAAPTDSPSARDLAAARARSGSTRAIGRIRRDGAACGHRRGSSVASRVHGVRAQGRRLLRARNRHRIARGTRDAPRKCRWCSRAIAALQADTNERCACCRDPLLRLGLEARQRSLCGLDHRRHSCAPGAPRHAHAKRRGQSVAVRELASAHRRPIPNRPRGTSRSCARAFSPRSAGKLPRAEIVTERGTITLELYRGGRAAHRRQLSDARRERLLR